MKYIINKFAIVLLIASSLLAHELNARTCAEDLKHRSRKFTAEAVIGAFLLPIVIGVLFMPEGVHISHALHRDAERLQAATIVTNGAPIHRVDKSQKVIDNYYDHLMGKFPEMKMSKGQVVALLDRLNLNGVDDKECRKIGYIWGEDEYISLTTNFFPDHKARKYLRRQPSY